MKMYAFKTSSIYFCVICLNVITPFREVGKTMVVATTLRDTLFNSYDKKKTGTPTDLDGQQKLRIQLSLQSIVNFDTASQTITVNGWWRHYWQDARLKWDKNTAGYKNEKVLLVPREELWVPDDVVYESIDVNEAIKPQITVYESGEIFYSQPKTIKMGCSLDLKKFPFDVQSCKFTLGSWAMNKNDFDIIPRSTGNKIAAVTVDSFKQHTEMRLIRIETEYVETIYSCCPEPYAVIEYTLVVKRESLSYVYSIIVPMALCTIVGFLGFLLNPDSGERIGLGITTLLTVVAIYFVAHDEIPKVGEWTVMSKLYMTCMFMMLATVAASIVVVSLYNVKTPSGYKSTSQLLTLFSELDVNKDGFLDKTEIVNGMSKLGIDDISANSILKIVHRVLEGKMKKQTENKKMNFDKTTNADIDMTTLSILKEADGRNKKVNNISEGKSNGIFDENTNKPIDMITFSEWALIINQANTRWRYQDSHNILIARLLHMWANLALRLPLCCRGDPNVERIEVLQRRSKHQNAKVAPLSGDSVKENIMKKSSDTKYCEIAQMVQKDMDIDDFTQSSARRLAGFIDLTCCIALPFAFLILIIIYFNDIQSHSEDYIEIIYKNGNEILKSKFCEGKNNKGFISC